MGGNASRLMRLPSDIWEISVKDEQWKTVLTSAVPVTGTIETTLIHHSENIIDYVLCVVPWNVELVVLGVSRTEFPAI